MTSRVKDDPTLIEVTEQLDTAQAGLRDAEQALHDAQVEYRNLDEGLVELEAKQELGEATGNEVRGHRDRWRSAKDTLEEAERTVRRKQHVVRLLEQRQAEAEDHAVRELREQLDEALRDAVTGLAGALKSATEANQHLDAALQAYRDVKLRPPHADLAWRDLEPHMTPQQARRMWQGDRAAGTRHSRLALWLEQVRKLGYDV